MKPEQPQLPYEQIAPELAPTPDVGERVRPDGIPEDAWVAMQGLRARAAEREPFSLGGRKITRDQLLDERDAAFLRSLK